MIILEKGTQFGSYSVLFQLDDGNGMRLQFPNAVSDVIVLAEAQKVFDAQVTLQTYNAIETFQIDILEYKELLKDFIVKIKATPSITLAQYNTWLGTKQWYEAAIIRYFVYNLARRLSERKGITLTNLTETTVLTALRNWIVATNLKTIGKVIGYGTPND
jgi:hypothetical protein